MNILSIAADVRRCRPKEIKPLDVGCYLQVEALHVRLASHGRVRGEFRLWDTPLEHERAFDR